MIELSTTGVDALLDDARRLMDEGDHRGAAHLYRDALLVNPRHVPALGGLALSMQRLGYPDIAADCYRDVIRKNPGVAAAYSNLGAAMLESGRAADGAAEMRRAIAVDPSLTTAWSALQIAALYDPDMTAEGVLAEAARFDREHAGGVPRFSHWDNDCDPDRRLRVGFVGGDFNNHPVARFISPILSGMDRSEFAVYCYHTGLIDDTTALLRLAADHWTDAHDETDASLADRVRTDRIDILIDLGAHTHGGRPLLFARKPAPVQMSYLAYPGDTGLSAIDWWLTDAALGETGRTITLQNYWCYPEPAMAPDVGEPAYRTNGFVTFGCLNNFSKVNDRILGMWRNILATVPDSRMLLLCPAGESRDRVRWIVGTDRVEFVDRTSMRDYFGRYNGIDVSLDTWPYAGGTTTCDSLWMGTPVVTMRGDRPTSRSGASILSAVGLEDLITEDAEEYTKIAIALSRDMDRIGDMKRSLRGRMRNCVLMDREGFARDFGAAIRVAWRRRSLVDDIPGQLLTNPDNTILTP